jgi:NADPH-dependent 2,4-dienoyl-CoA reductase/sulfur reductase-like enzyme
MPSSSPSAANRFIPKIPGIERDSVCLATDVDLGRAKPGKRVVLIGAGLTGTETAVVLAQDGHEVTLIDMLTLQEIDGRGSAVRGVASFLRRMSDEAGVRVLTGLKAKEITKDAVVAEDMDGNAVTLPCDSVVLSMGVRPRRSVIREFEGCAEDVYVIGDCAVKAGNILSAVRDGFYAAMNI